MSRVLGVGYWVARVGRSSLGTLFLLLTAYPPTRLPAQARERRLTVFNAGSLGRPLREALNGYAATAPGTEVAQENAGSLESARKLTELHKIPDVIALADEGVFPALLMPGQVTWYAAFARNEMVLAYTDRSSGADQVNADNWATILLRPGVRTGRSDPALDPNGYRTLFVLQLEERRAHIPGLAARLLAAMPARYIRPKEADLIALLQAGELDYAWSYRNVAQAAGLRFVDLPPEVDLGDPARAALYATASIRIPAAASRGPRPAARDSITIRGAPILYALSIPREAQNPADAQAFVQWLFGAEGKAVLTRNGFTVLDTPILHGATPPWLRTLTH
ncbi:MAG TPA: extracellular solute-binding protein [Gemmatimonadales bacterium]|nr:extracellular solute-binding protein [Gemmatimonadales bacterium]